MDGNRQGAFPWFPARTRGPVCAAFPAPVRGAGAAPPGAWRVCGVAVPLGLSRLLLCCRPRHLPWPPLPVEPYALARYSGRKRRPRLRIWLVLYLEDDRRFLLSRAVDSLVDDELVERTLEPDEFRAALFRVRPRMERADAALPGLLPCPHCRHHRGGSSRPWSAPLPEGNLSGLSRSFLSLAPFMSSCRFSRLPIMRRFFAR